MSDHTRPAPHLESLEIFLHANVAYIVFGLIGLYATLFSPISLVKLTSRFTPPSGSKGALKPAGTSQTDNPCDIAYALSQRNLDGILFFGSQTGTAEDYARRLGKALQDTYDANFAVVDLEDFDMSTLSKVIELRTPSGRKPLVGFVVATYGDGEPTDNATSFNDLIINDSLLYSNQIPRSQKPLHNLHYLAFGLGNSTYEQYNVMVRRVSQHLDALGAARIGEVGEGDDGLGTTDENFLDWKSATFLLLEETLGFEQSEKAWEASYIVEERLQINMFDQSVDLGDSLKHQSEGPRKGAVQVPVQSSKQMYNSTCVAQRECLHLEFGIDGTDLTYTTGDHVGVWPSNPDREVARLLLILALTDRKDTVISIAQRGAVSSGFAHRNTTYATVLRHRLEICGSISREVIPCLLPFAPSGEARNLLTRLGSNKTLFQSFVTDRCLNLGQLLQIASHDQPWTLLPFAALFEFLSPLQPRYYSISSSSMESPRSIHVTTAVKRETLATDGRDFHGVASNYLRSVARANGVSNMSSDHDVAFELATSRSSRISITACIQVRTSHFRLPDKTQTPIIMIGPGTGVAPFRAFVQERVKLSREGASIGDSVLYFGCRTEREDLLYPEIWESAKRQLGDKFSMRTAFSRQGPTKVYVQHRLLEDADRVFDLLDAQGAWLYICGDAKGMAKDVHTALESIVVGRGRSDGKEYLQQMKQAGRFHEDVW